MWLCVVIGAHFRKKKKHKEGGTRLQWNPYFMKRRLLDCLLVYTLFLDVPIGIIQQELVNVSIIYLQELFHIQPARFGAVPEGQSA
jgi:hypothetical protein